jgi:cell division protein FtsI (penicillin-binding protein 3)
VVEGTGKEAALNGYSSAGKTGTAQKIDVATHTYSHTKLVASFAGFAPVSSPAISVAVVIDTPTVGASKYGGAVSAPVFASVAQQVLEYLGVPHDQPLKTKKEMVAQREAQNDAPSENVGDLNAMFDDVNSLPADDPLRTAPKALATAEGNDKPAVVASRSAEKASDALNTLAPKTAVASRTENGASAIPPRSEAIPLPKTVQVAEAKGKGAVVVNAGLRVPVPSFEGAALRSVVERAGSVGLRVQAVGSGLAREQVPAAGTMVPSGTEIVVRFSR